MTTQMVDKSNFDNEQYKADLQCAYDCGYAKGQVDILKKIKAEIYRHHNITCNLKCATCFLEYNCELRRKIDLLEDLAIIDNHIKELKEESKEYEAEVITRGNCMICGKELTEGLFLCKECENKTNSRK